MHALENQRMRNLTLLLIHLLIFPFKFSFVSENDSEVKILVSIYFFSVQYYEKKKNHCNKWKIRKTKGHFCFIILIMLLITESCIKPCVKLYDMLYNKVGSA